MPKSRQLLPKGLADGPHSRVDKWSVSLKFFQELNSWEWPTKEERNEIFAFLLQLTNKNWVGLQNHSYGPDGQTLLKRCESENLTGELQENLVEIFSQNPEDSFSTDWIYEFIYCAKPGDRRRILGILSEGVFYVLWWDSDHRAFSHDPSYAPSTAPCNSDCLHSK